MSKAAIYFKLIFLLLVSFLCVPISAVPLHLEVLANFYPPNPCSTTQVGGRALSGYQLQGFYLLSYQAVGGDIQTPNPGPPELPLFSGLACGDQTMNSIVFDFDFAEETQLFLTFIGNLLPEPGPPDSPVVMAFPAEVLAVTEQPAEAPRIAIASLLGGHWVPEPGPPELPLFAFASPGHLIGHLEVRLIPLSGTLGLCLWGLLWWVGRHWAGGLWSPPGGMPS